MRSRRAQIVPAVAAGLLIAGLATAADEPELGWSDKAELGYVVTAGNAESSTLGFKNTLMRRWESSSFTLKAGGVRAESTKITRTAYGTMGSFRVDEDKDTETTAENYYLDGRYDHRISDSVFWFAGGGWDRNRPAGIENRYSAYGGVGNTWFDRENARFKTDYAATLTDEQAVVEISGSDDQYTGLRVSWEYWRRFNQSTEYGNDLILNENLDNTSDLRADMTNWLQVAMTSRLALKVSLQWLYDAEPAFVAVPLFDAPGGTETGEVLVELDDLDTIFTASLVANF